MLIEVVISALLVGLIVIATLTGFDVVNRTTADQRQRDEAAVLAAQSQEQLRSDPASALELLETSPHQYTQASGGNTYTITQQAKILGAGESSAACNVTQKTRQSGNAIRVTSTVTWNQQAIGHRPGVTESSVITPPTGSGFEVDAGNAPNATEGVAGVTAEVQYTPGKGAPTTVERTTGTEGCVVFAGIPATSALVFIKEKIGYVTVNGSTAYPPKEVTLAPNYTTHDPVVYNRGGAITASFTYKASNEYGHPNNEGSGEVKEAVTGDTFVAFNAGMGGTDFEVGSTHYSIGGGGIYEPLPGQPEPHESTTPKEPVKYPNGNLFPFLERKEKEGKHEGESAWIVYAGDCTANDPETVVAGFKFEEENVAVHPAESTTVKVPTSYVNLSVYKGTKSEAEKAAKKWEALETTHPQLVTITNPNCAGVTPDNEAAVKDQHVQETTTEATSPKNGGHLRAPFQPFGEFQLCLYDSEAGTPTKGKTYAVSYDNNTEAGSTASIYLGQPSQSEQELRKKEEEKKEEETKAARIKKEEEPRIKREGLEATKKTEAKEKEEEVYGKAAAYSGGTTYALNAEVKSGGLLYKSLKANNKNHNPSSSAEWWSSVKAARESEEAKTREAALKAEEKEKEKPRKEAETEETKTKEAREKHEEKETEEDIASKVTVESGKTQCP